MQTKDRRTFLKEVGLTTTLAAGAAIPSTALGANERPVVGLIGGKGRGNRIGKDAILSGARIKTLCDIDDEVLTRVGAEFAESQEHPVGTVKDYREVLDDPEIDAVLIATPDHWHAIQMIHACQAEKDVYIEKPLSHTIHEGQQMLKAARRYKRVVQMGTQRRSMNHFKTAIECVKSGALGKVCLIKTWAIQVRNSIGNPPDSAVPSGVDYDRWLGPAPKRAFNKNRFHYSWRYFLDYCNTELGNQGVHFLDLCLWAIAEMRGIENCLPTRVSGHAGIHWLDDAKEVPDTQLLTYDYGDLVLHWELNSFGIQSPPENSNFGMGIYGTEGALIANGNEWVVKRNGKRTDLSDKLQGGGQAGLHVKNFLDCLKTRERPNADIAIGRLSTTICHLGNIASRLKRDVMFDPKTETFGDDAAANAFLKKEYRKPYTLPDVG